MIIAPAGFLKNYRVYDRFIERVHLYSDGIIQHSTKIGYLADYAKPAYLYSTNISLTVGEISKRNKTNLDRGGHFYRMQDRQYELYLDLALDNFVLGPVVTIVNKSSQYISSHQTRLFTGYFGNDRLTTITLFVQDSIKQSLTPYGEKLNEISSSRDKISISDLAENPKLIAKLMEACLLSGVLESNPTLENSLENILMILKLS